MDTLGSNVTAVLVVVAGAVFGWLIDVLLVGRLLGRSKRRGWRWGTALAKALTWQPVIWGAVIGVAALRPLGLVDPQAQAWIFRVNNVAGILSLTVFASRLAGWAIRGYLEQEHAPSGTIFINIARAVVWTVGGLLVLTGLGIEIGPLLASLGIAGLAVSLGLQDTLANVFNGLQITVTRDLQPGDVIRLSSGEEGTVEDVTWRNTTLRNPADDLILIPNAVLGRSVVTKLGGAMGAATFPVTVTVAAGTDIGRACEVAEQVAREVQLTAENAVRDFEPVCRTRSFSGGGVTLAVQLRANAYSERFGVIDAFVRALNERFAEEGIEFAMPPVTGQAPRV